MPRYGIEYPKNGGTSSRETSANSQQEADAIIGKFGIKGGVAHEIVKTETTDIVDKQK
tara:strand:+ start:95 stop:268 length:174 start_codon:yes stop_codon:yes gene_type:complete